MKVKEEEVDRNRGRKTILKSGQELFLPAQLRTRVKWTAVKSSVMP